MIPPEHPGITWLSATKIMSNDFVLSIIKGPEENTGRIVLSS